MSKKKSAVIVILVLLIAAAVAGGLYYFNTDKTKETPTETVTDSQTSVTAVPEKYNEYYEKNNDFVGWIKIDSTHVDYPVVQTDNNDFYLNHNFEKEEEGRGSIFMDMDCSASSLGENTVLYGHNWLDKTMFSELTKYSDLDFYKEHPVVEFNTRTNMYKWKIFAVFITSASADEDNGYIFNYIYPNMGGENFDGYMSEIKKRSLFETGVDVNKNDKILTLSTCTREVDTSNYRADCRIVIVARMVRDGESASVDTSVAKKRDNPKYPQIWYDLKGLENPYKNDEQWYPVEIEETSNSEN